MLSSGLLTADDIDEIGHSAFHTDQPLGLAAKLVDAVDRGLVADQAETGYALIVAAEITARQGGLQAAEVLAGRAVEAERAYGDPDGYGRAFHAELLLRLGRTDEAMAEFTALRPKLSEDVDAVSYISESLEGGGRADIAEQWLTVALPTALQREQELASQQPQSAHEQAVEVVSMLAQQRHRLRRGLGLPRDEHDHLAERLLGAMHDALSDGEPDYEGTAPPTARD